MRRLAAVAALVVVGAGAAIGAALIAGDDGPEPATGGPEPRPEADTVQVSGAADALVLSPTLLEPVALPATVEAGERGAGSGRVGPVLIDGTEQFVAWPGGTPLTLDGAGGLVLDPTVVAADGSGLAASLGGVVGVLEPGAYSLRGSVAVGPEGLGRPSDAVSFEATLDTRVTFDGDVLLKLPPEAVTLEGPGGVSITGDLDVVTAGSDRRVTSLEFGPGPYRFSIVWAGDRMEIDGVLQGDAGALRVVEASPTPPPAVG